MKENVILYGLSIINASRHKIETLFFQLFFCHSCFLIWNPFEFIERLLGSAVHTQTHKNSEKEAKNKETWALSNDNENVEHWIQVGRTKDSSKDKGEEEETAAEKRWIIVRQTKEIDAKCKTREKCAWKCPSLAGVKMHCMCVNVCVKPNGCAASPLSLHHHHQRPRRHLLSRAHFSSSLMSFYANIIHFAIARRSLIVYYSCSHATKKKQRTTRSPTAISTKASLLVASLAVCSFDYIFFLFCSLSFVIAFCVLTIMLWCCCLLSLFASSPSSHLAADAINLHVIHFTSSILCAETVEVRGEEARNGSSVDIRVDTRVCVCVSRLD